MCCVYVAVCMCVCMFELFEVNPAQITCKLELSLAYTHILHTHTRAQHQYSLYFCPSKTNISVFRDVKSGAMFV